MRINILILFFFNRRKLFKCGYILFFRCCIAINILSSFPFIFINNTTVVIVVVIISSIGISLVDYFFGLIVRLFFGS
jgi:hypothetical protein